ncbi:uncharacterized protein LOC143031404 [Oratosquilla oratoria]|uniref:uncharacterized protein LOC143031404 n=1 Tax=Oratosquilla oratoria TaxID=337810 RepID=UPI003F75CAA7
MSESSIEEASSVSRDVESHTSENSSAICEDSSPKSSALQIHYQTDTGGKGYKSPEKLHKCTYCEVSFTHLSRLNRHILTHTGEKPFKCILCGASFSQSGSLDRHHRIHTGEKPHKCALCGASYSDSSCLRRHIRTHTGEKPHKCTFCEASFCRSHDLKIHIRTHTGERPYKCTHCEASFSLSCSLSKHMRTHTGERPYKCTHCSASFAVSGTLYKHVVRTHNVEKPLKRAEDHTKVHKCPLCNASFSEISQLTIHFQTHTSIGEVLKNYYCDHEIFKNCNLEVLSGSSSVSDSSCGSSNQVKMEAPSTTGLYIPRKIKEEVPENLVVMDGISDAVVASDLMEVRMKESSRKFIVEELVEKAKIEGPTVNVKMEESVVNVKKEKQSPDRVAVWE